MATGRVSSGAATHARAAEGAERHDYATRGTSADRRNGMTNVTRLGAGINAAKYTASASHARPRGHR
eukprot:8703128-Pyramimonas_sp.AAC.1